MEWRVRQAALTPTLSQGERGLVVALIALCALIGGCGTKTLTAPGGKLAVRSQSNEGATLAGGFDSGYYEYDDANNVRVVLFDGPPEQPTQAAVITMFWNPRAGRTPIDPTATNATVQYVIFSGESEVGIYSGAGFMHPKGKPGGDRLSAAVWQATLRLTDRSENFQDLLGQAILEGNFSARRDDAAISQMVRRLNLIIRERLGYPRLVRGE